MIRLILSLFGRTTTSPIAAITGARKIVSPFLMFPESIILDLYPAYEIVSCVPEDIPRNTNPPWIPVIIDLSPVLIVANGSPCPDRLSAITPRRSD